MNPRVKGYVTVIATRLDGSMSVEMRHLSSSNDPTDTWFSPDELEVDGDD